MATSISKRRLAITALSFIAIALIVYGGWGIWQRYHRTHNPHPGIPVATVTRSTDVPDETPLGNTCANYKVAADQPRQIKLPTVGDSGCVQKVGVDQNNAIAVPTSIYLAGWYSQSVLPGQPGVSVIDGHVLGHYKSDAIFSKLGTLKPGDPVKVQLGDKSWLTFQVVSVDHYPVDQVMQQLFKPLNGVAKQLTLITCSGTFDKQSRTFDQRTIVRTKLI